MIWSETSRILWRRQESTKSDLTPINFDNRLTSRTSCNRYLLSSSFTYFWFIMCNYILCCDVILCTASVTHIQWRSESVVPHGTKSEVVPHGTKNCCCKKTSVSIYFNFFIIIRIITTLLWWRHHSYMFVFLKNSNDCLKNLAMGDWNVSDNFDTGVRFKLNFAQLSVKCFWSFLS